MKALEATGVYRKYGKQEVLNDFSLNLDEGDFVALMGPSGSGKSTFLNVAAGLLTVDRGKILIGEGEITAMNDTAATKFRRRHIGVIFQAFNLVETLNVADNISLSAKLDGARLDRARLEELIAALGLVGKEKKFPRELSGGEQQRVAIARALYSKPEVILADEPTGNLDSKSAKAICEVLKELNEKEKSAILVVTHDPQVAATAEKVAFLKEGRIAAIHQTLGDAENVSRLYLENYK